MRWLSSPKRSRSILIGLFLIAVIVSIALVIRSGGDAPDSAAPRVYQPRTPGLDTSGYTYVSTQVSPWSSTASREQIAASYAEAPLLVLRDLDFQLSAAGDTDQQVFLMISRAMVLNYQGKTVEALAALEQARSVAEGDAAADGKWRYTIIYYQGVSSLRLGEDENCIMCRGEGRCILPIARTAKHSNRRGSEAAIAFFTEYLERFPDDLDVKWLLNFAHMTLDQYPSGVAPAHLVKLERFDKPEFDIGRFRDVGAIVGVNRLNFQGGGIMDDFDHDGLLDIVTTANHPSAPMAFFRNRGDGTFEDRTKEAGLSNQTGGLYCVQADYNNDGQMDVFIPRGAWMPYPVRPTLLRNDGNGRFTDVTYEAGLDEGINSLSACWADFDCDGNVDLFIPAGLQRSRLYRNLGNGRFQDVALAAGVAGDGAPTWRSAVWFDFNRDGFPDLFVSSLKGTPTLYRNDGHGKFTDVTAALGIDGPQVGFACWAWDYDNDGWPDLFATCYEYPLRDVIRGLQGQPHSCQSNRLFRNLGGRGFKDVTKEAGLDLVFATMGCNFADFDNDGWLDFFLGTGGPDMATIVPSRMFRNVAGTRFSEITGSARTGSIQKGHSVACSDWDRNGTVDIFIEMGGVTWNTRFHNMLYQNPGQGNNWLNLKLVGAKSNRAAIGAYFEAEVDGMETFTIHREVTSGSSFGANPLEQMIGLGKATRLKTLKVHWPATKSVQTFHDIPANQAIEITEGTNEYRTRQYKPIPLPESGN